MHLRTRSLRGVAPKALPLFAALACMLAASANATPISRPSVLVMQYDALTSVVAPVPWSSDGFSFGPNDTLSIGTFGGYGLVVIDPPGGGRTITIPKAPDWRVAEITEAGGKVTVRYTDGSTAKVPGVYVPPDKIELNKGKDKAGKAAAAAPALIPVAAMDQLMSDFGSQDWNMMNNPFVLDYSFGGVLPFALFDSSFDVFFDTDGPLELTFSGATQIPEIDPATGSSALSLAAGVLAMIEQRRRRAAIVA